jgi:hypothetical protein
MRRLAWILLLIASATGSAFAGTVCPGAATGTTFPHPPDPTGTGCNVVITISASGTATISVTDPIPYRNTEGFIVGVVNNSANTVTALSLSGSGVFDFDGDGICTFNFPGDSYCTPSQRAGTDPADYQGPTSSFSNFSSGNSGTVIFSPPVPAGGSTYLSLEGHITNLSASATVSLGTATSVPTLSTWVLLLTATLLLGLGLWQARRSFRPIR